jgi:hypothetical protein
VRNLLYALQHSFPSRRLLNWQHQMLSTIEWAKSHRVPVEDILPSIEGQFELYPRTAHEVAIRAVILQGVVAVGYNVDPEPVIEWFHDQNIWNAVTPREKEFLQAATCPELQSNIFCAHQEAEWTLLWTIGKVEALGLPTHYCDTGRLVDEIIPALGSDIEPFLASATLRPSGVLLNEDLRTYNLWSHALVDRREKKPLPYDLNMTVLYERRYAFEWLDSRELWDNITCDA